MSAVCGRLVGHEPPGYPAKKRAVTEQMAFKRPVDVPAIAKLDTVTGRRGVVTYSPHGRRIFYNGRRIFYNGRRIFYNGRPPCFHVNPRMNAVAPSETRWTVSYFIFYDGDVKRLFAELTKLHEELARREGCLDATP